MIPEAIQKLLGLFNPAPPNLPPQIQKVVMPVREIDRKELEDVASTIAAEAAGEGYEGMQGVASTMGNRSKKKKKPLLDIISAPSQYFGYTAENRQKLYEEVKDIADEIAEKLIRGELEDNTFGAEYFLLPNEKTRSWHGEPTVTIGNHTFYKEAEER